MMTRARVCVSLCLCVGIAAGCARLRVNHLAPLEDAVVAIDDQAGIARIVRVEATTVESEDIALSEGPATILAHPTDPGAVFVYTLGRIGSADEEPVPSELVAIDRTGEQRRWAFSGQFGSAEISGDGRYVIARSAFGRLVVENRVEIVDTTLPAGETNPIALSLRSLGGETPTAAAFSTPLPWSDGGTLRVAALFAAGQLSLFDLDHPEVAPITIPTTTDPTLVGPQPVEGVFVGSELVIRTDNSRQLLVVTLGASGGERRFDVSVRTLAAAGAIGQMWIDERGSSTRIIATTGLSVHFFDLETGIETSLAMPHGYHEVVFFEGPAPGDPTVRPRLVLHGYAPSLMFVDLGDEPTEIVGSSTLPLTFSPVSVIADPARGRLVLFDSTGQGPGYLDVAESRGRRPSSVIDLFDRSAIALGTSSDIDTTAVTNDNGTMWIAGRQGYVARFDLDTQDRFEAWLSSDVETLLPLHGESRRVLAFHSVATGSFSILEVTGDETPRLIGAQY